MSTRAVEPRVWLVGGTGSPPPPAGDDQPALSDLTRVWLPGPNGEYHTEDGRHHASWADLHARHDLVEVLNITSAWSRSSSGGRPAQQTAADTHEIASWRSAA
jgi:hypothetical protein